MARPRRFPLFRIGLTLVVGSALASLLFFYIGLGQAMADMRQETIATEPRDLVAYFTKNYLFAGTTPGVLLYVGLLFMVLGIVRNFTPRKPGATAPSIPSGQSRGVDPSRPTIRRDGPRA